MACKDKNLLDDPFKVGRISSSEKTEQLAIKLL